MKMYAITFLAPYKDGTWYPRGIKRGETIEVDEHMLQRLRASGFTEFTATIIIPKAKK
jgi:hypothetical protein